MSLITRAWTSLENDDFDPDQRRTTQALADTPLNSLSRNLDNLRPVNGVHWMKTFLSLDALDLVDMLKELDKKTPKAKSSSYSINPDFLIACSDWAAVASAFVGVMGSGTVVPGTKPSVTWPMKPGVVEAFEEGVRRLVVQAPALHTMACLKDQAPWPTLDSKEAQQHQPVRAISTWASMACFLDRPDLLKSIVDAFPEAMSTATPLSATRNLGTLKFKNADHVFWTPSVPLQFVSPMVCAMHAQSTSCIDVLLDKRQELKLDIDPPMFSMYHPKKFTQTLVNRLEATRGVVPIGMVMHALRPVLAEKEEKRKMMMGWAKRTGQDHPELFTALANEGHFKNQHYSFHKDVLGKAILWIPEAVPALLVDVPWDHYRGVMKTLFSPFLKAIEDVASIEGLKEKREASLLAFISQAKADDRLDVLLQNFPCLIADVNKNVEAPIAQLSEAGFDKVVVAFLDHGFNPQTKPAGADLSLIELATLQDHPTLSTLHSYLTRDRIHRLLDEMNDPEPKAKP